ncbi:MAG: hypothetical protein BWZ08_01145 [candidate division BRC1 bacterium ADurb.BinA292]|nr:MAG: hypothetical protein BWZ08_01145 [candidate division BRC1 bacterium ADurb.BinA292]
MPGKPRSRGYSLVEVMIAMVILSVMTSVIITSFIQASRSSRINSNAVAAKNIAQGYFEMLAIEDFERVGNTEHPDYIVPADYNNEYEDKELTDADPVWLDQALGIRCAVDFEFRGFGIAENGSSSMLVDNDANWEPDEWKGHTLFIVSGVGEGQFVEIAGNGQTTLDLASSLAFPPAAGDRYMINNGKTVRITTTWTYMGRQYQQSIESLICNFEGSDDFGF